MTEITLRNTGGGNLQVNPLTWTSNWLNVIAVNTTAENLGTYAVQIDRSGLADGVYSDTITVPSTINDVQVSVIMQVSSSGIDADAGFLYVLLIDDMDQFVDQVNVAVSGGQYVYQFVNVSDGSYIIVAGTDSDNDFFICDSGEACGAFLTAEQPQVIVVDQNIANVDFPVERVTAIPIQSLDAETEPPHGYVRLIELAHKELTR